MQEREHRRLTIGVLTGYNVYTGTLNSFLAPMFHGVRLAARDRGCNLLLACGVSRVTGEDVAPHHPAWPVVAPENQFVPVGPWNTDGLIVIPPLLSESRSRYIQDLIAAGHPVVFAAAGERGPAVVLDNEEGVRQAVAHLVEHGHRRIAFVAGVAEDVDGDSGQRLRAYRSAVEEWNLEVDPNLVAYGEHRSLGGYEAMGRILASEVDFTAVLASNDDSAFGVLLALNDRGLHVPEDVAVIGFDDRLGAAAQEPPLTTVHYSVPEVGYRALELLLGRIAGQVEEEIVKVPVWLVTRQSCGCQPVRLAPGLLDQDRPRKDALDLPSRVAQEMAEAVLDEARQSPDEVHALCRRLVGVFGRSLECGEAEEFFKVLDQVLRRVEMAGDDPHVWQAAVSMLEGRLPALLEGWSRSTARRWAEDVLAQARIAISERMRRQHRRYMISHREMTDQLGMMTAWLLAALDGPQIYDVLQEHLPGTGIGRADIVFFEPQGDDPLAWSVLQTGSGLGEGNRFPSRQFPPQGLYPLDEPFSLALLPLSIQEDLSGFVAFDAGNMEPLAAITRQLAAAIRSARLYREAAEGRRLAEEASRLKSRFLSTVSHELRTPLNLVIGLSEMLLEGQVRGKVFLPRAYRQDLERIHASAQHLDGLIRDVLDLARSEVGRLKLACEPLDLTEVLGPVAAVGEQMARDKGLAWRVEMPGDLPRVWGDRTRLRQVALNLVSNAVKFTTEGETVLRVSESTSRRVGSPTRRFAGSRYVTISVSDTGLGIPPEEQDLIFDEFRQSERTAERGYGGLGLGLAICRRLVEMHGGEIGVESSGKEGEGSAFFFTLPVMGEEGQESRGTDERRGQAVLLLTEKAGSGERLRAHLARQGFEVEEYRVEETAGWLSRVLGAPPGAVVLNLGLASEEGWEVLKVLKGNPATQDVPVLFYSLEQGGGAVLEVDYLTKPVGTAALAQALERQGLEKINELGERIRTILVVDDEPGILEMHARVVQAQSSSYRVLEARNGREALEVIRRERPDLVLLDLMMPELDGFGVLEAMQEEETIRDIPVIVLTGQVLTEEDMARLNRGVAAVLGKGLFSVEETLAHVEGALAHNRRLGSESQRVVRRAMAYLHVHYAETVSRQDVARYVGVSGRHLTRCFRQEMGVTPVVYLNRYRVRQARALLEEGRSVTEVAMEVGFSNASYFSRVFRREVGVPPSAYRRAG